MLPFGGRCAILNLRHNFINLRRMVQNRHIVPPFSRSSWKLCRSNRRYCAGRVSDWRHAFLIALQKDNEVKRKLIILLFTIITTLCLATALSACVEPNGDNSQQSEHSHTLEYTEQLDPTCTTSGHSEYWHCVECDTYFTDSKGQSSVEPDELEIPQLGHRLVTQSAKAPTCTKAGWESYSYCLRCDYKTSYQEIPPLGHDYIQHEAKIASCTEGGWDAYQTCSRCDYTTFKEVAPVRHNYTDGKCQMCGKLQPTEELTYSLSSNELYYSVSGINSTTVKNIVIDSTFNGLPVNEIAAHSFSECDFIESIIIPDSILSIGDYAFSHCDSLTSIEIPDSVTQIGAGAFYDCSSLKSIALPNGITKLEQVLFDNCISLTDIIIPDGVKSIEWQAFYNCSSLTSINIPNSVTAIGSFAFSNCHSLNRIYF